MAVLATHRVITLDAPFDPQPLLGALSADFAVAPHTGANSLTDAIRAAAGDTVAIGLCICDGNSWVLTLRDQAAAQEAANDMPSELAALDVCVLQNLILSPLLGISADALATSNQVSYTVHEAEACERVRRGEAHVAFVLNPTSIEQVWRAAQSGVTMPQKSTYFYPKLLTGLVINSLDDA